MASRFDIPAALVKQLVAKSVKKAAPVAGHSGAFDESAFATAFQQLQKAAPKPVVPAAYRQAAEELGVRFEGMQHWPKGSTRKPFMQFTDPVTGSTFGVDEGAQLLDELMAVRKKFGVK